MVSKNNKYNNAVLVHRAENAIDQMKYEIAQQFGVQLGSNTTSRTNGSVGGEITKRLVQNAQMKFEHFMRGDEGGGSIAGGISASDVLSRMNGGQRPTGR